MNVEVLSEKRTFQIQLVIVGNDFVNMGFCRIQSVAFLYLHHHHWNSVDDLLLFLRLLFLKARRKGENTGSYYE